MARARQKLRTLAWYLRRPRLYGQLARDLRHEMNARASNEPDCWDWCAKRAVDPARAIELVTGSPAPESVERRFRDILAIASERAERATEAEPDDMPDVGGAELDLLYWLAEHVQTERAIETGVAYGWSSLALLLSMRERPAARLISTDIPLPRTTGAYIGSAVPDELREQWTILRGLDRKVLTGALEELGSIDYCHYDSDKSYGGRRWAYGKLWDALEPGGLFISDDVGDNAAFRDFASEVGVEPVIVLAGPEGWKKHVGVLSKGS